MHKIIKIDSLYKDYLIYIYNDERSTPQAIQCRQD